MKRNKNSLALYVHYPFCLKKCPYCDFNSHVRDRLPNNYLDVYKKELDFWSVNVSSNISSVFFGGGTPSLMSTKLVEGIIDYVDKLYGLEKDCEITLEANPTSSEASKFKDFRNAGVNRLSIGIQSLNDSDLKFLGREHSAQEAIETIQIAQKNFDNYSFDLIYCLPKQSIKAWQLELREALNLAGKHLSLYQLTIELGTKFWHLNNSKKIIMPDNDTQADFYEKTTELCSNQGFEIYEISNYAQKGFQSKHNLAYWRYQDYLGIGAGAHSRVELDDKRYAVKNYNSPEKWTKSVMNEGQAIEVKQELTQSQQDKEKIIMGLRLKEGVEVINNVRIDKKIATLLNGNLIEVDNNFIKTTDKGRMVTENIVAFLLS